MSGDLTHAFQTLEEYKMNTKNQYRSYKFILHLDVNIYASLSF